MVGDCISSFGEVFAICRRKNRSLFTFGGRHFVFAAGAAGCGIEIKQDRFTSLNGFLEGIGYIGFADSK
jgi:hypothetical protein